MGMTWIRLDGRGCERNPEKRMAPLSILKHVIGNSLVEYATRLHAKELVSKDVEQVAIAV